jgi:tubulin alpha
MYVEKGRWSGTGSGFGSLLLDHLTSMYGRKSKLEFSIYPSPRYPGRGISRLRRQILYTASLSTRKVQSEFSMVLWVERTSSLRFDGALNVDLAEFQTNLVPYPRIHYPLISYPFGYWVQSL